MAVLPWPQEGAGSSLFTSDQGGQGGSCQRCSRLQTTWSRLAGILASWSPVAPSCLIGRPLYPDLERFSPSHPGFSPPQLSPPGSRLQVPSLTQVPQDRHLPAEVRVGGGCPGGSTAHAASTIPAPPCLLPCAPPWDPVLSRKTKVNPAGCPVLRAR